MKSSSDGLETNEDSSETNRFWKNRTKIATAGAQAGATRIIANPIRVSTAIARIGLATCSSGAKAIEATATQIVGITSRDGAGRYSVKSACTAISHCGQPGSRSFKFSGITFARNFEM